MKNTESKQILEYLKRIDESINGPRPKKKPASDGRPLSERVIGLDKKVDNLDARVTGLDTKVTGLDTKVTGLDRKLGTSQRNIPIAVQLDALDRKVEHRFNVVDLRIDTARDQVVDLVTRVHDEVTKRVVDLEEPAHGRKGNGGRGSGGGGVPLAS